MIGRRKPLSSALIRPGFKGGYGVTLI